METAADVDDAEVVKRSHGAPERFAVLFDWYFTSLHMYAGRRLGRATGDDVAAETFLVAFRERSRFDPARGSVRVWLYGIATNLIRGHHRPTIRKPLTALPPRRNATERRLSPSVERVAVVVAGR